MNQFARKFSCGKIHSSIAYYRSNNQDTEWMTLRFVRVNLHFLVRNCFWSASSGHFGTVARFAAAPFIEMNTPERIAKHSGTSSKSILLIAPQPFFVNRGTPINVRAMVSCLGQAGYQVDLLVYPRGEELELPGVTIRRSWSVPGIGEVPIGPSWKKIVLDIPLFIKALWLVLVRRYSVIHGVEEGGCIAGILARLRRIPYIFDMDSSMPRQLEESGFVTARILLRAVAAVESYFVRRAAAVLTVCKALSDKALEIDPEALVYQIEDFPSESATLIDDKLVKNLQRELACNGRTVVLYTGNLEPYQGIDLLLESFARVCQGREEGSDSAPLSDLLLLLVGGGEPGSSRIRRYKQMAQALGIAENVRFVGSRPGEQMGSFMSLAEVLVSPRLEGENTPLKLYSYMASSKPVVATRVLSHLQVLDEETAYLAEPTVESFATAIRSALDDSPLGSARRARFAQRARELVENRYSLKEFENRLRKLYFDVVGPSALEESSAESGGDESGRRETGNKYKFKG